MNYLWRHLNCRLLWLLDRVGRGSEGYAGAFLGDKKVQSPMANGAPSHPKKVAPLTKVPPNKTVRFSHEQETSYGSPEELKKAELSSHSGDSMDSISQASATPVESGTIAHYLHTAEYILTLPTTPHQASPFHRLLPPCPS